MKKLLIGVLSLLILIGCSPKEKEVVITLLPIKMGDVLELETLKFEVIEVSVDTELEGKFGTIKADEGVEIVSVRLSIENIMDEDLIIGEGGFKLYVNDELEFLPSNDPAIIDPIIGQVIPPGKEFTGFFYYSIDKGMTNFSFRIGHAGTNKFYQYELLTNEELGKDLKEEKNSAEKSPENTVEEIPKEVQEDQSPQNTKPKTETPKVVENQKPSITTGMRNAKSSAENYISFMPFSRQGLIDQLLFEGYSEEESVYGVDSIVVDWNEQAALSAQKYLDMMSFSRQGLIDQLVFEGYSYEQAEYGVNAVGY